MWLKVQIIIVLFLSVFLQSQEISENNSYVEIYDEINKYEKDDKAAFQHIAILIAKSKKEKNYQELYKAYRKAAAYANENLDIIYADSCIWAAKHTTDSTLLGYAYLTNGIYLNGKRKYDLALDKYLESEKYLRTSSDTDAQHKLLLVIGQIKNYLEMYDEAIPMIENSNNYFKKLENRNDSSSYLYSLNALKEINVQLGNYEKATEMYHKGKALNASFGDDLLDALLDLYEGFNLYEQKKYSEAIDLINNAIPILEKRDNFSRLAMANYYLGLCYSDIGDKERAIVYLRQMDTIFKKENYTSPRFRAGYERMILYYKQTNNTGEHLWALNNLIKIDSTLDSYFKGLSKRLKTEYDTELLYREKDRLEKSFMAESNNFKYLLFALSAFALIFVFISVKNYEEKRKLKKLYNQYIENRQLEVELQQKEIEKQIEAETPQPKANEESLPEKSPIEKETKNKTSNISDAVVQEILKNLNVFEKKRDYLEKGLTLGKLAKSIGTNTSYLSAVINHEKRKPYTSYINELRINYLLRLFDTEKKYHNYTINSLAEEIGYSNAKTFNKAFKETTGMPASYFLERYTKENKS